MLSICPPGRSLSRGQPLTQSASAHGLRSAFAIPLGLDSGDAALIRFCRRDSRLGFRPIAAGGAMPRRFAAFHAACFVVLATLASSASAAPPVFEFPIPLNGDYATEDQSHGDWWPAIATDGAGTWVA